MFCLSILVIVGPELGLEVIDDVLLNLESLGQHIRVDLWVRPEHRIGNGYGTRILAPEAGKCNRVGLSDVELEVNETLWEDEHISRVQVLGEELVLLGGGIGRVGSDEPHVESAFHQKEGFSSTRMGVGRVDPVRGEVEASCEDGIHELGAA
ncbi:hypothetical protein SASPL_138771 [Salvia splendens]|uniref:Uncharacterized protein n=1 Tax=Salvia splendens TaxID=180675 RepID=A0A8X8WVD0_SALSN|nr:hypothetical protein SASPL_138771 [Salvia splendens]